MQVVNLNSYTKGVQKREGMQLSLSIVHVASRIQIVRPMNVHLHEVQKNSSVYTVVESGVSLSLLYALG